MISGPSCYQLCYLHFLLGSQHGLRIVARVFESWILEFFRIHGFHHGCVTETCLSYPISAHLQARNSYVSELMKRQGCLRYSPEHPESSEVKEAVS